MFHRLHTQNAKKVKYSFDHLFEIFVSSFENECNPACSSSETIKVDKLLYRDLITFCGLSSDVNPEFHSSPVYI